jgi:hypothetical protein
LTRDRLLELLPAEQPREALLLIERLLNDRPLTALEEKLISAGADVGDVAAARQLRAMSEVRRYELLAGPEGQALLLEDVSNRVLLHANGVARLCKTRGESASDLFAHLVTDSALSDTDPESIFNKDRPALVGLLCCLSDECKFGWGAP